jgi:hypothetical protein
VAQKSERKNSSVITEKCIFEQKFVITPNPHDRVANIILRKYMMPDANYYLK